MIERSAPAGLPVNRQRLSRVLEVLKKTPVEHINFQAYWIEAYTLDDAGNGPVGCPIGHYIRYDNPRFLTLEPINFYSQIKSQLVLAQLLGEYPPDRWAHFVPRYGAPDCEAWGMTAVCLYFSMRPWDVHQLFFPAGVDYRARTEDLSLVIDKIDRFLEAERFMHS